MIDIEFTALLLDSITDGYAQSSHADSTDERQLQLGMQPCQSTPMQLHSGSSSMISFPVVLDYARETLTSGVSVAESDVHFGFFNSNNESRDKKHVCTICEKRFVRASSLRVHVVSHTIGKAYTCPWPGCGAQFSVQSNMRRHERRHHPASPHEDN